MQLVNKASKNDFEDLLDCIIDLENQAERAKRDSLQRESYCKRFNLLIHGLDESKDSPWEPNAETQIIFNEFLTQGLHLDPIEIPLVDIHRLPQRPIVKNRKSFIRPIVIKLLNTADKHKIMKSLGNLKAYNQLKKRKKADEYVSLTIFAKV